MTLGPTLTTVVLILLSANVLPTVNADHYDDNDGFHSIQKGERKMVLEKPVDILLYHESVKVKGKLFPYPKVISHDICYPPKGHKNAKFTITTFDVTDQNMRGLAFIKEGTGVDKNKLCLHFKSQRGKGYHFEVNIFGYYN